MSVSSHQKKFCLEILLHTVEISISAVDLFVILYTHVVHVCGSLVKYIVSFGEYKIISNDIALYCIGNLRDPCGDVKFIMYTCGEKVNDC